MLFLRKFTKEDGDKPEGDLYTLMWGAQGKETLPEEGREAMVGAAGELAAILALTDLEEQARRLRHAVTSPNPIISDTALTEVLKQSLGDQTMIGVFVTLLVTAIAAAFLPARNAAKLDPMVALRAE